MTSGVGKGAKGLGPQSSVYEFLAINLVFSRRTFCSVAYDFFILYVSLYECEYRTGGRQGVYRNLYPKVLNDFLSVLG